MKFRLMAAVSLAVGLLISACSQAPVQGGLEAQFGTAGNDEVGIVAVNSAHPYVYLTGTKNSVCCNGDRTWFLRRYNRDGRLAWEYAPDALKHKNVVGMGTDARGNVYFAFAEDSLSGLVSPNYLYKFDKNKRLLWRVDLSGSEVISPDALTVDAAGNVYMSLTAYRFDEGNAEYTPDSLRLRKYAPNGRKLWGRALKVTSDTNYLGIYSALALSEKALYIASDLNGASLLSYDLKGAPVFDRVIEPLPNNVAVGGTSIYVSDVNRYNISSAITTYNELGTRVKRKVFANAYFYGLSADGDRNAYVIGGNSTGSFIRKYTSASSLAWTYQPNFPLATRTGIRDVAVRTKSEIYVVGSTDGKVNGVNKGGTDAFLLRLNARGQKVWER